MDSLVAHIWVAYCSINVIFELLYNNCGHDLLDQ